MISSAVNKLISLKERKKKENHHEGIGLTGSPKEWERKLTSRSPCFGNPSNYLGTSYLCVTALLDVALQALTHRSSIHSHVLSLLQGFLRSVHFSTRIVFNYQLFLLLSGYN